MEQSISKFDPDNMTLEGIDLLQAVPPKILSALTEKCTWHEFQPEDIVVDVNDEGTSVYFIVKGRLRVLDFLTEETEVSLAEAHAGGFFGELSALDKEPRSARVTALDPTLLAELSSEDFNDLLHECPEIAVNLLHRFAEIVRRMTSRVTTMSTLTPHQRVYSELLNLAEPDVTTSGLWIIENAPNHQELSTWVGTDKQSVADAIGSLARDGVIERKHKKLIIKDHTRLQRLVGL